MKATEQRTPRRRTVPLAAAALCIFFMTVPVFAQTSEIPERLPADTIAYLHWRGKPYLTEGETKNHILQLIEDPDFLPLRQKVMDDFRKSTESEGEPSAAPTLHEIISLLENPAAAGIMLATHLPPAKDDESGTKLPAVGFFFVYDTTGKTALIDLLKANPQVKEREPRSVVAYDFEGVKVEGRTSGTSVSFTARAGHYYLGADQKRVVEELIRRFRGAAKPSSSVSQLAAYQEVRPYVGADAAIELFAQNPGLENLIAADQKDKPFARALNALHLDKIHTLAGGVSLANEATRLHGVALGDTTPVSPFDLAGESAATFSTEPAVSAGPYFSISRLNLPALHRLIRAGVAAASSPQTPSVASVEAMAKNFLGMSIEEAFQLFTGEIASQSSYSEEGIWQKSFAITIQRPQDVLRVIRAAVGSYISAENTAGDTTFLDLSYSPGGGSTDPQKRTSFYVAVTPQMLFAAPKKSILREEIARFNAASADPPAAESFSSAELKQMRGLLPQKLSGLSAADLSHFPWETFLSQLRQNTAGGAKDAKDSQGASPSGDDYWNLIKPETFSRHLHAAISGWWKDSSGIYFDTYVQ